MRMMLRFKLPVETGKPSHQGRSHQKDVRYTDGDAETRGGLFRAVGRQALRHDFFSISLNHPRLSSLAKYCSQISMQRSSSFP